MRLALAGISLCLAITAGCGGSGGSGGSVGASGDMPLPNGGNAPPVLAGTPVTLAWQGDTYAFAPRAMDADGDSLEFRIDNMPSWAAFDVSTGRLTGVPSQLDVGTYPGIRIGASDGQHQAWLPVFDVTVRPVAAGGVTVTWEPPYENTDDSPLDDLTGFNIYWGLDPQQADNVVAVAGRDTTEHRFEGLAPGIYYFATTAVNAFGIESEISDFAMIRVR